MYYVYIAKSTIDHGYYIGYTMDIAKRLDEHNNGKTKSVRHRIPLTIEYIETYDTKTEARKRELLLKKNYQVRRALLQSIE